MKATCVKHYGHGNFTPTEVLYAFYRLVDVVNDPPPYPQVKRLVFAVDYEQP